MAQMTVFPMSRMGSIMSASYFAITLWVKFETLAYLCQSAGAKGMAYPAPYQDAFGS